MRKGMTLLDTLFSILIITISVLFVSKAIIFSLHRYGIIKIKFSCTQKADFFTNHLKSIDFDSAELEDGNHTKKENEYTLTWTVTTCRTGLKKIGLTVQSGGYLRQCFFYKSKTIKEVKKND